MAAGKENDVVIAKFDYKATDAQELHIQKGEKLTLIDDTQHWWKVMNSFGQVGYVPSNYVKRSKQGLFSSLRNTLGRRKSRTDLAPLTMGVSTGCRPPPPQSTFVPVEAVSTSIGMVAKTNEEALKYVAPLMSSSASDQSPVKSNAAIGYQPIVAPFFSDGIMNPRPSLLPCNQQLPPVHPGLRDQSPKRPADDVALEAKNGCATWNASDCSAVAAAWAAPEDRPVGAHNGGGSISSRQICVARFAYTACQPDELTMQRGDRVCVLEKSSDGWWHGVLLPAEGSIAAPSSNQQSSGWFPSNYVTTASTSTKSSLPSNASQPNSLNCGSQALTSSSPHLPPASMGARSSTQFNSSAAGTVEATHVSTPPPPISTSHEPSAVPSFASYSAVSFPNSNAFSSPQSQLAQSPPTAVSQPPKQQPSQLQPASIVDGTGSATNNHRETVLTLYPFARNQIEELSFAADEVLEVLNKPADDPDWWCCRNAAGNIGLVPCNYIRVIKGPSPSTLPSVQYPRSASATAVSGMAPQQMTAGVSDSEEVRLAFAAASPSASEFVHRPWYWGVISRNECESILNNLAISGEFIIRDSESHPGDLTITMNAGSKNRNFKVHVKNGEFYIGQKVFSSVDALINNYRRHPIYKSDQEKHFLTQPFQHPNCVAFLQNPFPPASSLQTPMIMESR